MGFPTIDLEDDCAATDAYEVLEFSRDLMAMLDGDGVSMIHCSMDDVSTKEHGGMSAVVGYVASSQAWNKFNWRWTVSLLQLKHPYLHTAKDLANFALVGGDGMTDEDVFIILSPFIAIIQEELMQNGAFCICIVTEQDGYEQLTEKERMFIRPPAINSFEIACAFALRSVSNPLNLRNCISLQMDESQNAPELYKSYQNMKRKDSILKDGLGALCFCDDRHHPPIQAADLLAHVTLRAWRTFKRGKEWPKAFRELAWTNGKPNLLVQTYSHSSLKQLAAIRMKASAKMAMPDLLQ